MVRFATQQTPTIVAIFLILCISTTSTEGASATVSNTLNANINALGALSVPGSASLTQSGTVFNAFSGTVTVQYRARTSAGGGGNITMKVTQDFQAGGPSVSGGDLTYSCGAAGLGATCGASTASTTSATSVVILPASACTGGGAPCSASDPNSVIVTFGLADQPVVKTGSFTASVQFTISAT